MKNLRWSWKTLNKEKILALIGFAYKSRKLVSGEGITLEYIKSNKAKLVFIASDASENTRKRISDKCNFRSIELVDIFTRYEIGKAIGKEERVAVGITDQNFADSIKKLLGGGAYAKNESL